MAEGSTCKLRVVSFNELVGALPETVKNGDARTDRGEPARVALVNLYHCELGLMLREAQSKPNTEMVMTPFEKCGEQYIARFWVNDLDAEDKPNLLNFHFQNISRWLHGGALVVEQCKGAGRWWVSANH